uniref:Leucine-rich alpha-2-glycoprotein 1 n=2 Tax=Nannospalax galili TaxID=1026970 RepID=A0A8C6RTF8_NANGA
CPTWAHPGAWDWIPTHLFRMLLLLLALYVASTEGITPNFQECLVLHSANGSTVTCYSPTVFPGSLPADTVHLSIEFSNLTQLPVAALWDVPDLVELHLSSNHLESLSSNVLLWVPRLRVLDLTGNALRSLPPGLFHASAALDTLVLKENRLHDLNTSSLQGLKALGHLDLSGNCLRSLPPQLLANLTSLRVLDLGNNLLESLPEDLLQGPLQLDRLHLEGNQLAVLGAKLLAPQGSLRYLFLNDNKVATVAAGAFQGLNQLDMLDLSNNSLASTPQGLWTSLGRPARDMGDGFDISHNPWICDSKLHDLYRWLDANRHKMFSQNETQCAGPKALKGQRLLALVGSQ